MDEKKKENLASEKVKEDKKSRGALFEKKPKKEKVKKEKVKAEKPEKEKKPSKAEQTQIVASVKSALVILAVVASCFVVIIGARLLADSYEKSMYYITDSDVVRERVLPAPIYVPCEFEFDESENIVAAYEAYDKDVLLGYCIEAVADGYEGKVRVIVGIDGENKVSGVEIVEMSETPGIGTKISSEEFLSQFASKSGIISSVKSAPKDETQISVVSGATTSSEAVCKAVNNALAAVSQIKAEKELNAAMEVSE